MKEYIERRVIDAAFTYLKQPTTIRKVAKKLGTSSSTVHLDLRKRLPKIDSFLYLYPQVNYWLNYNKTMAPFRGGQGKKKKRVRKE